MTPKISEWIYRFRPPPPWGVLLSGTAIVVAACVAAFGADVAFGLSYGIFPAAITVWMVLRHRQRRATAQLGSDGLLLQNEFLPWRDVERIIQTSDGVTVLCRSRPSLTLDFLDSEGFGRAAAEALVAHNAAPPAPPIDALRVRVETSDERAQRLAELRSGSGYRGANSDGVDLDALEALLRNPAAEPARRKDAADLLTRLDPARLVLVQAEVEASVAPEFLWPLDIGEDSL